MKNLFFSVIIFFSAFNAHADTCGGVDSSIFNNVELSLENLYDNGIYEEGLSFHEYPGFRIELEEDNTYYLSVGDAGFSAATRIELVCNNDLFEMQIDFEGQFYTAFKDFKYKDGKVTKASVYDVLENLKIADFSVKGRQVVYAYLSMTEKSDKAHILSEYIGGDAEFEIEVDSYADYEIQIGSLSINTTPGNDLYATAILVDDTLYIEVPGLNVYLSVQIMEKSYDGEIEKAKVFVGQLDDVKPQSLIGTFEN